MVTKESNSIFLPFCQASEREADKVEAHECRDMTAKKM
jgi:hypothetical protein